MKLHQAVAEGMAETRGRVAEYVQKSNAAPGQLAAQQATNELLAVQVQQLQEMQAMEIAALRTELERQAGKVSAAEWEDAHLRGDQNATTTERDRVTKFSRPDRRHRVAGDRHAEHRPAPQRPHRQLNPSKQSTP